MLLNKPIYMYDFLLTSRDIDLRNKAREFVAQVPRELLISMDEDKVQYPTDFVRDLAENGLLGIRFPIKYGGHEASWVAEMAVLEEIGHLSLALGCLYSLPSICGEALNHFGTKEQKEKFLRPILKGELFCAEALTEPRGGSDFFGATTIAEKKGDHYILNGQKRFVVGAIGADIFLVYARTSSDPNIPPQKQISLFVVERDDNVKVKYTYGLMGTRGGGAGRLVFDNTKVPEENLIGNEGDGGKIFYQMMYPERMTSAAGILGMADASLRIASRYSSKRQAFGKPIRSFQAVSFKIAEGITLLDSARATVYMAARALDEYQDHPALCRRLVSEAKRVATEQCYKVIDLALQVMGGIGYTNVYPIERFFRDARLSTIWTGTSEIMNLIIQHEYYKEVIDTSSLQRDAELDAKEAFAEEEKVYK